MWNWICHLRFWEIAYAVLIAAFLSEFDVEQLYSLLGGDTLGAAKQRIAT